MPGEGASLRDTGEPGSVLVLRYVYVLVGSCDCLVCALCATVYRVFVLLQNAILKYLPFCARLYAGLYFYIVLCMAVDGLHTVFAEAPVSFGRHASCPTFALMPRLLDLFLDALLFVLAIRGSAGYTLWQVVREDCL